MAEFTLEIVTPEKKVFSSKVQSVTVPGSKGNFQVLFNHAPLISSLEIGKIKVVTPDNKTHIYATSGGTVEVLNNNVLVLAETLEYIENIDIKRAEASLQRAKERLSSKEKENIDIQRAEYAMARALNRKTIFEKFKK